MYVIDLAHSVPSIDYRWQETTWGHSLLGYHHGALCYLGVSYNRNELLEDMQSLFKKAQCVYQPQIAQFSFQEVTTLHLLLVGTSFQHDVWKGLLKIPRGKTISYGMLAESLGKPSAARAVANAIGRNPITLLVPCHRVIHKSGTLGGFRMGVTLKKRFLEEERGDHDSKAFV